MAKELRTISTWMIRMTHFRLPLFRSISIGRSCSKSRNPEILIG